MEQKEKLTPIQAYRIGDLIDFKVRTRFPQYCELIDESTGITSYLQDTEGLVLFKGQTVRCRILAVKEKHPKIELFDISAFEQSKDNLTEDKLLRLLESRCISWNTKEFVRLLLTDEKGIPYESQCHQWIQGLLNKKVDLECVRRDCSDLLELSDLLNICSYNERDFYQERLTLLIEQLGCYIKAGELIDNDKKAGEAETSRQFIDNLFNKLRISGFIYHPSKNFDILASIFLRKPELMNSRMKELLDIIQGKDIRIWEREPFGGALIKLLELYIRECDGRIDKTKDNKELINNNLTALAIQLLLIKDTKEQNIADYRLNAARLCLLASYLWDPARLVNAAYFNLFHSSAKLPTYTIAQLSLLPSYLSNTAISEIDTVNSFSTINGRLIISDKGISLQSAGEEGRLHAVFPKELGLWHNLQVYLPSKTETSLSAAKPNDIMPYQAVWAEIEADLFTVKKTPVANPAMSRRQHRVEETVRISFTSQDETDRNMYYCRIEDEVGGEGFILLSDIVPYSISTTLRHFTASDGSRLVFQAQIIDKNADGLFQFSMLEDLKSFCADFYSYDEDIICSVGSTPNKYGMSPAITKEGISVSLRNASDFEGIAKNSIVRCRLVDDGPGTFHIACDIVDLASYDFDLNTAFKKLMAEYSEGTIAEAMTQQEEEQILNSDKVLDEPYVREVIYMIDRMALVDTDYVRSYNYLGFARTMSLLIGWESQAAYYKGRMDIIAMLHDFAQNSKVDENKLAQLENANAELFHSNLVLRERFVQLQTVSYINKNEHNKDLFELACTNPPLKKLALLVLAYNITRSNGLESSATDIHNKIFHLLNLKGYETGLKFYGSDVETEESEYKSSFIYLADDTDSLPNPDKQKNEILKVIDSFFNTKGGMLYIGVNNFGYGVGIEDDLNSSLYYGDKDKYIRSIIDAVALEWGNRIATTYIKSIHFDEDNTDKDVLLIHLLPIQAGLPYKGVWYVRKAGTKRELSQEEFDEYQRIGRGLQAEPETVQIQEEEPVPNEELVMATRPLVTSMEDAIRTSRIRKNVLHDWEDPEAYVEPVGFFKFLSEGKFRKMDKYDYDDSSLLTLAVKDNETKGYLILGYENGHILKVPVEDLLNFSNRDYSRNTESKLTFASIAGEGDAVLTISKEDKTRPKTMMRLDRVANFEEGGLNDGGERPYNEGLASEALAYDVIPQEHLEEFASILDRPRTSLGYPASGATKAMVDRLHEWGITEI